MREIEYCETMKDIRRNVDRLDAELVELLAERSRYIAQAARVKNSPDLVRLPDRIEEVVENVKRLAQQHGLKPEIAEATWRPMVDAFIEYEMEEYKRIKPEEF